MKQFTILIFLIINTIVFSQNRNSEKILNEGRLLFRLEKASWYGTDNFLVKFKSKRDSIAGYLSYETKKNKIATIFFNRAEELLVRYEFDSIPQIEPIDIDTLNLKVTDLEKSLIKIRQDAKDRANENKDEFFSFYKNTALNFIPLITDKQRSVFVLTGPQYSGYVIIGNDYKLNYNKMDEFVKKEKIHNSILQFPYKSKDGENPTISTMHTHVVTEYISSTDICTLLLYKDYIEWKQHIVTSKKEVSIFDLDKELLVIMKMKAWKKISDAKK